MKRKRLFSMICTATALGAAGLAFAQDPQRDRLRDQTQAQERLLTQERERIYGADVMTPQERIEYRNQMRLLQTEQEREKFRLEHHARMQERAKTRGLTLPDEPPVQGRGAGPRYGEPPGMGMGPRPGAGPGAGGGKGR